MPAKLFTLSNDFHNSSCNVLVDRARVVNDGGDEITLTLSPHQMRRVRSALCGHSDCTCGLLRGPQIQESGYIPILMVQEER